MAQALDQLRARFGPEFQTRLSQAGGVAVLLNGENVKFLGGPQAKLRDGDTLSLLPPVAGG